MVSRFPAALGAALLALALGGSSARAQGLKVFISVDMEGITGVVTPEQLGPAGFEYAKARELMTGEVLAAIAGAREAGATQFVVADSHGNMQNLLIDRMPADVMVVRGSPRPLSMMEGIDSSFKAVMFIGYHAATTNPHGVRAHTMSSATLAAVRINGTLMAESGMNSAIAGAYGVPVVLVTGDDDACGEVKSLLGDVETAVVKHSVGFHSAITMTPEASQALIRARAKAAIQRLRDFKPHVLKAPFAVDLTFKNYLPAEAGASPPGTTRVDAHTVRYSLSSMNDVSRWFEFVMNFRSDLTP
jgi:D-amino peptidase